MSSDAGEELAPLDALAESFVERIRRGESPSIEAVAREHPELAAEVRELFPMLLQLERAGDDRAMAASNSPTGDPPPPAAAAAAAAPPIEIGGYRLGRPIGRGGMGAVYEAVTGDPADLPPAPPRLAVKLMLPHLAGQPEFAARFSREVDISRRITHPSVVATVDAGIHTDPRTQLRHPFLVMERVDGQTLESMAAEMGGAIPEVLLRRLAARICEGLEAIHASGIVHRDLKPANLMVTADHRVCVMDLGVACSLSGSDRLSDSRHFVGSVRYAAPEFFDRRLGAAQPASDLYCLGVTLYELATGVHPFAASTTPGALMQAHLYQQPAPARELAPEITPFLSSMLDSLLAKAPGNRFASAHELHEVLVAGEASSWWAKRTAVHTGAAGPRGRLGPPQRLALVGRRDLLQRLESDLARLDEGGGGVVLLQGEAGIGKSRVIAALVAAAQAGPACCLYGGYDPGGGGGFRAAFAEWIAAAGGTAALAQLLPELAELHAPFLAYVQRRPLAVAQRLDAETWIGLLAAMLEALARRQPVLLVIEDLHFASDDEFATLLAVARSVACQRVLLVTTSRPEPAARQQHQLLALPSARCESLSRLTEVESLELVKQAAGGATWSEPWLARIATESDGNPFFALQILQEVRRQRQSGELSDSSTAGVTRRLPLPPQLRALIELRLAALGESERILLECAALVGFEFDPDLVADALGRDRLEVLQQLAALERRDGLVRSRAERVAFDHHLIQESLADRLPESLARAYHARLAGAAGKRAVADDASGRKLAALIAVHAMRAGQPELALPVARQAILQLLDSHRLPEAAELCDLALAAVPAPDPELAAELHLFQCQAQASTGTLAEHDRHARAALAAAEACGRADLLLAASFEVGAVAAKSPGDRGQAVPWFTRALELARATGNWDFEHRALLRLAEHHRVQRSIAAGLELAASARELAHRHGSTAGEAEAVLALGLLATRSGEHARARAWLEECLTLIEARWPVAKQFLLVRALAALGGIHNRQGNWREAASCWERGLLAARIEFRPNWSCILRRDLAGLLMVQGRLGEALELFEQVTALVPESSYPGILRQCLSRHADACVDVGQLERAAELLEQALAAPTPWSGAYVVARHDFTHARLLYCLGDLADAARITGQALATREASGSVDAPAWSLLAGAVACESGAREEAVRLLATARDLARRSGETWIAARADAWLARALQRPAPPPANLADAPRLAAAEILLNLHAADPGAGHLEAARAALAELEASLGEAPELRLAFRERGALAGLYRAVTGGR